MPDLPTLTVTTAQAQRITAAFGTVTDYRKWLRNAVIMQVVSREGAADQTALETEIPEPT